MRIRKPFAAGFVVLLLLAAFAGLAPNRIQTPNQSDKVLHFITFFLLTTSFYWIIETNRRRVLQITLLVCSFLLGGGSEVLQGILPNGRNFDVWDIVANLAGSLAAVSLCTWYHKRMLDRKRKAKNYHIVPGGEVDDRDLELGEGLGPQESGVTGGTTLNIEEELNQWDENADDWDVEEPIGPGSGAGAKSFNHASDDGDIADVKTNND